MALRLRDLTKRYVAPDGAAVPIIDVPAFELGDGEQVGLVGGSGTGKTTLLHLIAGILAPDKGEIWLGTKGSPAAAPAAAPSSGGAPTQTIDHRGAAPAESDGWINLANLSEAQRDVARGRYIGYVFQTHHLLGGFTALENVLLGMSFTGRAPDSAWAKHLLTEVGLSDRLSYRPAKLSVGQQQRVAVARALANRPRLVLADEPTGALDPANAQQVLTLIRRLCQEVGASLLLVSHDREITNQLSRVVSLAELNRAGKE